MTLYRDRQAALNAWRDTVRDSAVLALALDGRKLPLSQLASRIGVDVKGLRCLLEPDTRFVISIEPCPRSDCAGVRSMAVVALATAECRG